MAKEHHGIKNPNVHIGQLLSLATVDQPFSRSTVASFLRQCGIIAVLDMGMRTERGTRVRSGYSGVLQDVLERMRVYGYLSPARAVIAHLAPLNSKFIRRCHSFFCGKIPSLNYHLLGNRAHEIADRER